MENSDKILPGARVRVFDSTLFKNDVETPLSYTIRSATVVCRYGMPRKDYGNGLVLGPYPDLIDVVFDHRPELSRCHFTHVVEFIKAAEEV